MSRTTPLIIPAAATSVVEQIVDQLHPNLRSAIVDSIAFQCPISVQILFEFGSCRATVITRSDKRKIVDARSSCGHSKVFDPPEETIDRNLRRAVGTCRSLIGKIEQDLVKTSKVTLSISFRSGQVAETDRRITSKYDTAADNVSGAD